MLTSWFLSVNSPAPELSARVKVGIRVKVTVNVSNNNSGVGELTDNYQRFISHDSSL